MYIYTGEEPLVRKKDLLRLCETHDDCVFLAFTNGTLIDEEFAEEMLRVRNFVPAISLEGFGEATDSRRGSGVYKKVIRRWIFCTANNSSTAIHRVIQAQIMMRSVRRSIMTCSSKRAHISSGIFIICPSGMMRTWEGILAHVVLPTLPASMVDSDTQVFINPTGRFVEGGPAADSGLTGRKLIVDTYGGYARHGGGAFSGKDASKVDRSGAYMARYLAKNIVAQGLAEQCEVQLSYAIGLSDPMSVRVDTFGTGRIEDGRICRELIEKTDLRPAAIIEKFDLTSPRFSGISCYGHFGSNASRMRWEKTDLEPLIRE